MTGFKGTISGLVRDPMEKKEQLQTLLIQATDLIETYKKGDFDSIFARISELITEQNERLETIRAKNTSRIPLDLTDEQIVEFFRLFLKVLNDSPEAFPPENRRGLFGIVGTFNEYVKADELGDLTKTRRLGKKIKRTFPLFLQIEFGIAKIEQGIVGINSLNEEQRDALNKISHPSEIFRELGDQGINTLELKEIPEGYEETIKGNEAIITSLLNLAEEEITQCEDLFHDLNYFFIKSDVVLGTLEKVPNLI